MAQYGKASKRKQGEKMTDEQLAAICDREFNDAQLLTTEIVDDRIKALDYYNQEKFGNEEEGLSQFVSSDVHDTVEWVMPQLIDIFVGGDTPILFEAENAEDVKPAEIESKYCQYVFSRQNAGVINSITWFKDALLQKNGVVKAYWDEPVKVEREEYKNKTSNEYMMLLNDPEYEIDEVTITVNEREFSEDEYTRVLQAVMPQDAAKIDSEARYHIVGYRKRNVGQVRIENVAPENFFIARRHNSIFINDAQYCGEWSEKTRSELVEMGYDRELVDSLPAGDISQLTDERWARNQKEGNLPDASNSQSGMGDKAREIVTIVDHYIRADFNGDGIAELRHVRTVGKGCEYILENDEVDRSIYHAITPNLLSYKFFGKSLAEILFDLQRAKSQLWRNVFDNTMYSTLPRKIISGNVDVEGLLTYVAGGVIRKDANATIENETTPFVANEVFPILDRMDGIRAERSGFSKETMGLNPDALSNSTNLVGMAIMAQSQLLVKMIATTFAHSGFKTLMEHIRELVLKYEKKERVFDLTGEFLETDPRSWRKQRNSVPKVGIGHAGKNEELSLLTNLLDLQQKLVEAQGGAIDGPLTNATGIYNTIKRLCQRMGFKDVSSYFQNPAEYQAPPPKPSVAELTLKAQTEKINSDAKIKQADQVQTAVKDKKDSEFKFAELAQRERLEMAKIESDERIAEMDLIYKYGKDATERQQLAIEAAYNRAERAKQQAASPKPTKDAPQKPKKGEE